MASNETTSTAPEPTGTAADGVTAPAPVGEAAAFQPTAYEPPAADDTSAVAGLFGTEEPVEGADAGDGDRKFEPLGSITMRP